ncbi:dihydrodipicolinate synthase family protein [Halomonas salipaludis]|uniref:Dihydrodipicolinate synthase family protein n=1 Tax=Halomonas salipaludis TaxID=2032625 RepID=A0A2A2EX76_9GAMM|nr:dihydrodipicolinate synthase family protein [Halomonas salipaludis]PAU78011.1 dihydrodipicolinate synthase family protein [Halomonas salipaludis]
MSRLILPNRYGELEHYTPGEPLRFSATRRQAPTRVAYAAAHVVTNPLAASDPWLETSLDWERTLDYRRYLWEMGFGVAEAMDTAQRGMGLDWPTSLELIRRSLEASRDVPGAVIACGCGTDHVAPEVCRDLEDVIRAYEEQMAAIEGLGGRLILMASRALAALASSPDDYVKVYDRILSQAREPVILHWLGEMFDPALAGYWGHADPDTAMQVCLGVIAEHADKVDGIKISLLDADKEVAMRRQLPPGVKMYSGDDFNYPSLIAGDAEGHSHALLGIFDAIAPAAAAALAALDEGDMEAYEHIFAPTVPLSRHIFASPTRFYKTGVVFMAYLNGHQDHFTMVGGQESTRSTLHLAELFRLADRAGLLRDPSLAVQRMANVMATKGVAQ